MSSSSCLSDSMKDLGSESSGSATEQEVLTDSTYFLTSSSAIESDSLQQSTNPFSSKTFILGGLCQTPPQLSSILSIPPDFAENSISTNESTLTIAKNSRSLRRKSNPPRCVSPAYILAAPGIVFRLPYCVNGDLPDYETPLPQNDYFVDRQAYLRRNLTQRTRTNSASSFFYPHSIRRPRTHVPNAFDQTTSYTIPRQHSRSTNVNSRLNQSIIGQTNFYHSPTQSGVRRLRFPSEPSRRQRNRGLGQSPAISTASGPFDYNYNLKDCRFNSNDSIQGIDSSFGTNILNKATDPLTGSRQHLQNSKEHDSGLRRIDSHVPRTRTSQSPPHHRSCHSCHTSNSAQQTWRTGWHDNVILCNQCGLRFNRNGRMYCGACNYIPTKSESSTSTLFCRSCRSQIR